MPVAPYNARNTDNPKDVEYRVEDQIEEHSKNVQLRLSTVDETYNHWRGVERTNDAVKHYRHDTVDESEIPAKYRELMGLAVVANI